MLKPIRERRRFHVALPLWIRFRKQSKKESPSKEPAAVAESTITENISTAGCYFFVSQKPVVGTKAEMEVIIPGRAAEDLKESRVRCHGKVIRVDDRPESGKIGVACTIDCYEFARSGRA